MENQQVAPTTKTEKLIEFIKQNYSEIIKYRHHNQPHYNYRDIPFLMLQEFEKIWKHKISLILPILKKITNEYDRLYKSKKNADFDKLIIFNKADFEKEFQERMECEVERVNRINIDIRRKNMYNYRQNSLSEIHISIKDLQAQFHEICTQLYNTKYGDEAVLKQLNDFYPKPVNSFRNEKSKIFKTSDFIYTNKNYNQIAINTFYPILKAVLNDDLDIFFNNQILEVCRRDELNQFEAAYNNIVKQYNEMYKLITTFETTNAKQNALIFATHIFNIGYISSVHNDRINKYRNNYTVSQNNKEYNYLHENGTKYLATSFLSSYTITNSTVNILVIDPEKVIRNTTLHISKDIQRVEVIDELEVHIHMHKHFDAEVIIMNNYEEAVQLVDAINSARVATRNNNNFKRY